MPHTEYKPEPLTRQIGRLWRDNRGNWLLAVGLLVSLLGWLVGYFDMIPEIEAVDTPNFTTTLIGGNTLTVEISDCASDDGKVIAMLYDGRGFSESSISLRMEELPIVDRKARWEIHNLSYGTYAVYAFQDLDGNEIVDPKVERQGVSLLREPSPGETVFNYASAAFDFSPQQKSIEVQLK